MDHEPNRLDGIGVMTFLGETSIKHLVKLAQDPVKMDEYLTTNYPSKQWGNISPDSQESQDAGRGCTARDNFED